MPDSLSPEAECAEVCTSGCHSDDCEHHDHLLASRSEEGRLRAMLADVAQELDVRAADPTLATFDLAATIRDWLDDPASFDKAVDLMESIRGATRAALRATEADPDHPRNRDHDDEGNHV